FKNEDEEIQIPILEIGDNVEKEQIFSLEKIKFERDEKIVKAALSKIKKACENNLNIMVPIIEAAKSYVTMGEIVATMKTEFGEWQETAVF
ncbi:MAG: methylmalonyl-CoA mutase, partial [Candidatus Marinimicrobia bacterium]|nr:methylmalonyl-CoA mutase [Candidatus Neomarinimicrobiota bacterium]